MDLDGSIQEAEEEEALACDCLLILNDLHFVAAPPMLGFSRCVLANIQCCGTE